ncbi:hypothetical protein WJX74_005234 [Apatococcus lobatus]|uniref:Dynein axonemal intermediate chain 4 n=1 Tax=Apatococcus lobatus TaxID=904363 RepID=A0AAW1RBF8_9CHLO
MSMRPSAARASKIGGRGTEVGLAGDHKVLDAEGKDRTPKPMLVFRAAGPLRPGGSVMGSDSFQDAGLGRMSSNAASMMAGGFGGHLSSQQSMSFGIVGGLQAAGASATSELWDFESESASGSPRASESGIGSARGPMGVIKEGDESARRTSRTRPGAVALSPEALEAPHPVRLSESPNHWIWTLPGNLIPASGPDAAAVAAANSRYTNLLREREGNDQQVHGEAQTLNPLLKAKETQTEACSTSTAECQVGNVELQAVEPENDGNQDLVESAASLLQQSGAPGGKQGSEKPDTLNSDLTASLLASNNFENIAVLGNLNTGSGHDSGRSSFADHGGGLERTSTASMASIAPFGLGRASSGIPGGQTAMVVSTRTPREQGVHANPLDLLPSLPKLLSVMEAALLQQTHQPHLLAYRDMHPLWGPQPTQPSRPQMPVQPPVEEPAAANEGPAIVGFPKDQSKEEVISSTTGTAQLHVLWQWSSQWGQDLATTCMAWNKARKDLIAAGYALQGGFGPHRPGHIALWSLRNPCWPAWHFSTSSGVASLDFSRQSPHLLAVGLQNGTVQLHDVKSRQAAPTESSKVGDAKHSEAVAQVRWVDRGTDQGELLVSISPDGRVTSWSLTEGLAHADLMKLRRVAHQQTPRSRPASNSPQGWHPNPPGAASKPGTGGARGSTRPGSPVLAAAGMNPRGSMAPRPGSPEVPSSARGVHSRDVGRLASPPRGPKPGGMPGGRRVAGMRSDGSLSRAASGWCLAFNPREARTYLAGTEEGLVHRCSVTYSEQYLATYPGHMGPVTALQWCPFRPSLFLSASADWTLKLWEEGQSRPVLTMQAVNEEVNDAAWCPARSTVLASATAGGRLELWDLAQSVVKPAALHCAPQGVRFSCLLFAQESPIIMAGMSNGNVAVVRVHDVYDWDASTSSQVSSAPILQ